MLEDCTNQVLQSLRKNVYQNQVYFMINKDKKRIEFNQTRGYGLDSLQKAFENYEINSSKFSELGISYKKALNVKPFFRMFYNRFIGEIAKKLPHPKLKNCLYHHIGIKIENLDNLIVSPNVTMEYLYPELISIKSGVIGEESHVWAHDLRAKEFVIGTVDIGEYVTIGSKTVILPGVEIGDNVIIGPNKVVRENIESGRIFI